MKRLLLLVIIGSGVLGEDCPHAAYVSKHECTSCTSMREIREFTYAARMINWTTGLEIEHMTGPNIFMHNAVMLLKPGVNDTPVYERDSLFIYNAQGRWVSLICVNRDAMRLFSADKYFADGLGWRLRVSSYGEDCFCAHSSVSGHLRWCWCLEDPNYVWGPDGDDHGGPYMRQWKRGRRKLAEARQNGGGGVIETQLERPGNR
jgi:hypothetical protein